MASVIVGDAPAHQGTQVEALAQQTLIVLAAIARETGGKLGPLLDVKESVLNHSPFLSKI